MAIIGGILSDTSVSTDILGTVYRKFDPWPLGDKKGLLLEGGA